MNESRERWLGAARRLARRVNLGTWLALWVPLATALSLASAALLVVLRRRAVTDLDAFWAAYAGALCLAGLAALVHTWRERETAPSALVWLEHRLGLNNRPQLRGGRRGGMARAHTGRLATRSLAASWVRARGPLLGESSRCRSTRSSERRVGHGNSERRAPARMGGAGDVARRGEGVRARGRGGHRVLGIKDCRSRGPASRRLVSSQLSRSLRLVERGARVRARGAREKTPSRGRFARRAVGAH